MEIVTHQRGVERKLNMQFRRLLVEDMSQILLIQSESYDTALCESEEELQKIFAWPICHGIIEDNKVVCVVYGYIEDRLFHIYSIESLKDYRKRGLGSKLIEFCTAYANKSGANQMRAWAISDGGLDLLLKFGFQFSGTKDIMGHKAVIMLRDLDQGVFTLGHTKNYDQSLANEPSVNKLGKTKDYEGGWVWATPHAARDFLVSEEFLTIDWGDGKPRNPDNFSIYVLKLSNTWAEDVSEPDELGNKHLLHDAQILNKYNWRS